MPVLTTTQTGGRLTPAARGATGVSASLRSAIPAVLSMSTFGGKVFGAMPAYPFASRAYNVEFQTGNRSARPATQGRSAR